MDGSSDPGTGEGTVADAYLRLLASRGVDYLFGNAGTDFAPLIEAYAAGASSDAAMPKPVLVPHENVAVAMAHGFAMVTGRPQAVMVHVGLGTANAACGLFNAARQSIPIFFTAGRTPWTEHGVAGGRNNYINWAQEMFDQAAMIRESMKWDFELRHASQLQSAVDRGLAIARSEPPGPVYFVLPREVLASAHSMQFTPAPTILPTVAGHPVPADIEKLASLLRQARRPVLITADAGRTVEGWRAMIEFSAHHGVPVVQYRPRYACLPSDHPFNAGYDPAPWLRDADLVLVVDCDVPWIPDTAQPKDDAKVVQIGVDPLFSRYPLRGFRSDLTIAASSSVVLRQLLAVPPTRDLGACRDGVRKMRPPSSAATSSSGMTGAWVSRCIADACDEDTVLLNEYSLVLEQLRMKKHGCYYSHSPAGGLGWAMGASLGVKLARPGATVIACVGDGTYMFGNPTPFHFVSRAQNLPVLTVIFNNRRWGAVHRATLSMYAGGHASRTSEPPFATLEPAPDYEKIVEACGGIGFRVEEPEQLPISLDLALKVVREERRSAVVNVITEIDFARTS